MKEERAENMMDVPDVTHRVPLSERDIEDFLSSRSPALLLIIAYLESGESWTMDRKGSGVEMQLIKDLGDMVFSGSPVRCDPVLTGEVLDYVRAGRMFRILDWLDAHPDNRITEFLHRRDVSETFRHRLKTILHILIRAELLNRLLGPERRKELMECL